MCPPSWFLAPLLQNPGDGPGKKDSANKTIKYERVISKDRDRETSSILCTKPYQPEPCVIPVQELLNRTFQKDLFVKYGWLHFDSCTGGDSRTGGANTPGRRKVLRLSIHYE